MRRATGARVRAEAVTLTTRQGPVYTGVDFTARPGTLTVFQADSGGGRSALLLTLCGRMRPTGGLLHVDGQTLPGQARKVRRISSLGLMDGVNALDERLRVSEHLSEARLLRTRPTSRSVTDEAMAAAGLTRLDHRTMVEQLPMLERRRLGVALALVTEPRLLVVDDVDGGLSGDHQAHMWRTLKDLADEGLTVIATCADARELATVADRDTQGPLPITQGEPRRSDPPEPAPPPGEGAAEVIGVDEPPDNVGATTDTSPAKGPTSKGGGHRGRS
jgi:ABC-2 type transport system ATP-binding protein